MKRIVLFLAVVATAVACAAPAARPTPAEAEMLTDVHTYAPELTDLYTDGELLNIAWSVCDAFAAGATQHQVLDQFAAYRNDVDLASLAGAAVGYLCPGEA